MSKANKFVEKNSYTEEGTLIDVISVIDAHTALKIQELEALRWLSTDYNPEREELVEQVRSRIIVLEKQLRNLKIF